MKVPIVTVGRTLASQVAGFAKLLLLPFTHDGFKPLYPLLKSKAVIVFLTIYGTTNSAWALNTGIDASSGLGYVQWIAANAKAQLIGTILIPVLFAIVLYIFNKTLGISLNASDGL